MTTPDAQDPARGRGRPSVLDREAVAAATFALWAEHGYAAVSWRDIAEATGISVRTLVRHFSRKTEIAWVGVPAATQRLREALQSEPDDAPVSDAVRRSILASASQGGMLGISGADWARVVYTQEELIGSVGTAYRPWIDVLAGYLRSRLPDISPAAATAIASAYQTAAFSSLVVWSERGAPGDAITAVDEALQWLHVSAPAPASATAPRA